MVKELNVETRSGKMDDLQYVVSEMKVQDGDKIAFITCEWVSEADDLICIEITNESIIDYLTYNDNDDERVETIRSNGKLYTFEIFEEEYNNEYKTECNKLINIVLNKLEIKGDN